jgi:hypothetical protein
VWLGWHTSFGDIILAKQTIIALNVPASVASGSAVNVENLYYKTIIFSGTFTATCQIQVSNDNSTWVKVGSDVTAASVVRVEEQSKFLRINTSAYTSGTPAASLAALNHRTD